LRSARKAEQGARRAGDGSAGNALLHADEDGAGMGALPQREADLLPLWLGVQRAASSPPPWTRAGCARRLLTPLSLWNNHWASVPPSMRCRRLTWVFDPSPHLALRPAWHFQVASREVPRGAWSSRGFEAGRCAGRG